MIDTDVVDFVTEVKEEGQTYSQDPNIENYNQLIITIMSEGFDVLKNDESWY